MSEHRPSAPEDPLAGARDGVDRHFPEADCAFLGLASATDLGPTSNLDLVVIDEPGMKPRWEGHHSESIPVECFVADRPGWEN